MNIKKVERICKAWKSFALIDQQEGDQIIQWIKCGCATYSLVGMPYMTTSQLLNVFGVRGEAQKKYLVATSTMAPEQSGASRSWPAEKMCQADPMEITMEYHGIEMMFFTCDFGIIAFDPEYIAPFKTAQCTFDVRWNGDSCWLVVWEGMFPTAAISPWQIELGNSVHKELDALRDGMRRAATWQAAAAERQRELEWAESHPGEQIEMEAEGEVLAECT